MVIKRRKIGKLNHRGNGWEAQYGEEENERSLSGPGITVRRNRKNVFALFVKQAHEQDSSWRWQMG